MKDRILNYLKDNGSITSWEAIKEFGCTRLSHYIWLLRKDYTINDGWQETKNRYDEKVKYKIYYFGGEKNV